MRKKYEKGKRQQNGGVVCVIEFAGFCIKISSSNPFSLFPVTFFKGK